MQHRLNVKTLGQDMEHCASCQDITGKSFYHLRSMLFFSPIFLYNPNSSPQVRKNVVKLDLTLWHTSMRSTWQTCMRAECLRDKTAIQSCSKSNQEWIKNVNLETGDVCLPRKVGALSPAALLFQLHKRLQHLLWSSILLTAKHKLQEKNCSAKLT